MYAKTNKRRHTLLINSLANIFLTIENSNANDYFRERGKKPMNIHANMVDNLNSNYENLNNIYTQETGYFMNAEEYVSSKFNKPAQAREKPAVPPKPKIYLKSHWRDALDQVDESMVCF